ncbi:hypothetical protein BDW75DRAFT_102136 [Aspergillus navahoensis]
MSMFILSPKKLTVRKKEGCATRLNYVGLVPAFLRYFLFYAFDDRPILFMTLTHLVFRRAVVVMKDTEWVEFSLLFLSFFSSVKIPRVMLVQALSAATTSLWCLWHSASHDHGLNQASTSDSLFPMFILGFGSFSVFRLSSRMIIAQDYGVK